MNLRKSWAAIVCCVVVAIAGPTSVVEASAADASGAAHRATHRHLRATVKAVGSQSVRVSGRAGSRTGRVTIQRRTATGWERAGRARIRRHHFARRLRQPAQVATYRVLGPRSHSRRLPVRLPRTTPATTTSTPSVDATAGTAPVTTTSTVTLPSAGTGSASPGPSGPRPSADACGTRPVKADGSLWSCTFDDEFAGTALDRTKWIPQTQFTTGTPDTFACYRDDQSNVAVSDGTLNLTVRRETTPQPCAALPGHTSPYTAGMVSTYHLFSQQYGRFEARMKSPTYTGAGLQDDFWLWPDDRYPSTAVWPAAGEIDVMEHYSHYANLNVPFLHYGTGMGSVPGVNTAYDCSIKPGAFNTYTLTWTATRLEIDVNGSPCLVNTSGDPAFQKPYIVALTQALGGGTNGLTADTPLPATVQVDYVRVWS